MKTYKERPRRDLPTIKNDLQIMEELLPEVCECCLKTMQFCDCSIELNNDYE